MKLSVAVPAYNQGRYLRQTIESLLGQTAAPHEIVVSDNHSTDETASVLDAYKDRVRVIRPPTHLGAHHHFDFLVGELTGDWFSILSSDDVALPRFVESMQEGARVSERAVLVRADYERIDGEGRKFGEVRLKGIGRVSAPPQNFYEQLRRNKAGFASFAARHATWRAVGGFGEEVVYPGDWSFWLRISSHGDFVHVPRIVSQYRSSYRPGLDRERLVQTVRDELVLRRTIIPRVAREHGQVDERRVARAARERCHDVLREISRLPRCREQSEAIGVVAEWAEELGLGLSLGLLRRRRQVPRLPGYVGLLTHVVGGVLRGRAVGLRRCGSPL